MSHRRVQKEKDLVTRYGPQSVASASTYASTSTLVVSRKQKFTLQKHIEVRNLDRRQRKIVDNLNWYNFVKEDHVTIHLILFLKREAKLKRSPFEDDFTSHSISWKIQTIERKTEFDRFTFSSWNIDNFWWRWNIYFFSEENYER